MSDIELIPVSKGADYLEVHPSTLAGHKAVGWVECERRESDDSDGDKKPSDGLTTAQLKDALTAKGIEIPEGAKKTDLQALLDAAE